MRFVRFEGRDAPGAAQLALENDDALLALPETEQHRLPGDLGALVGAGAGLAVAGATLARHGRPVDRTNIRYLPPLRAPSKIVCVGLNYRDHTEESNFQQPDYPTIFARFQSSMIGHLEPIQRPQCSEQLDFEGEMAVFIGKGGRHISKARALDHVAGYAVCNDASVRDVQFRTPQWTVGKNFDATGPIGPAFVTADEVPLGGSDLHIETRLNGQIVQSANTRDMVFDVATLIEILSEAMTLNVGDIIVSGTPAGVGFARKPPLWMKPGDTVEVEIEGIGLLSNPIVGE